MIAYTVLLIVLLALTLLLFLKIGVWISYCDENFKVDFIVGRVRFSLGKAKKEKENKAKSSSSQPKQASAKKVNPWPKAVLSYWQEILSLIGRVLRTPALDDLSVKIDVADSEPDNCAMKYGTVCAAVGAVMAALENTFVIKKKTVDITCSFDKDGLAIEAGLRITLKIYEIIVLAIAALKLLFSMYRWTKINMKVV